MSCRILYVCTHNRCRSIIAEAVTNHLSGGRIMAASAGSHPAAEVHPLSIGFLEERQIPTDGLHSKSWQDLVAFTPKAIITLCDSAAEEACPLALGSGIRQHWPLQDPSAMAVGESIIAGTDEKVLSGTNANSSEVRAAFFATIDILELRVKRLLEQDLANISETELARQLDGLTTVY